MIHMEMVGTGATIDVLVNGNIVLNEITLSSGSGPGYFSFPVEDGDDISVNWIAQGSYPSECYYEIYDGEGTLVYIAPTW